MFSDVLILRQYKALSARRNRMDNLRENDWNVINDILLEIYSMDNVKEIATKFFKAYPRINFIFPVIFYHF